MQFEEENTPHLKEWIIKRLENMYVRLEKGAEH
jgi:hypothetical protein